MANPYFSFKQFTVYHDRCAMKVTTDACLFGAWVASQLEDKAVGMALDIGTGTGLIALMIAQKTRSLITAVEIDAEAAAQAKENIERSPWTEQIKVINENILDLQMPDSFDHIICNPPFYENELASPVQGKNIAHHSELLTIGQVLRLIHKNLSVHGSFFLLLPAKRSAKIEKRLEEEKLFVHKKVVVRQSTHHQPFRVMISGTKEPAAELVTREIFIWDENKEYSNDFRDLLKDYYLYL